MQTPKKEGQDQQLLAGNANTAKKKSKFLKNKSMSMCQQLQTAMGTSAAFDNDDGSSDENENGNNPEKKKKKKQIGIFEQFKIKYDQVRKDCQNKRKQIEELSRVNKRQEIQLLNVNTDYYDREIKRLRQEVQKLQELEEDYKDKYLLAENKKNQLEASANIKEQAMKKQLKQIENEKIQNVEIKHKMVEKQKQLMNIVKSLEKSNEESSERYSVCEKKFNEAHNNLRMKQRELEQLRTKYEKLEKNKQELSAEQKKVIEKYQKLLKNTKDTLEETQQINRQSRSEIVELRQVIGELKHNQQKNRSIFQFEVDKKLDSISKYKDLRKLQVQNKKFGQQNYNLKQQNKNQALMISDLKKKIKQLNQQRKSQQKHHEERTIQLQNKKNAIQKHYELANLNLKKQIEVMRVKAVKGTDETLLLQQNSGKGMKSDVNNVINQHFKQLLDRSANEVKDLKAALKNNIDEVYKLKSELEDQKIHQSLLKNQIEILKKKSNSSEKNSQIEHEIEIQNLKNQLQALKRKYSTLQAKLASKIKEIKQKDTFITTNVIGKSRPQDGQLIFAEIQRVFESDYIGKLSQAQEKIKQLEKNQNKKV